jgi:hypothetical protein
MLKHILYDTQIGPRKSAITEAILYIESTRWILGSKRLYHRFIDIKAGVVYGNTIIDRGSTPEISASDINNGMNPIFLNEAAEPRNIVAVKVNGRSGPTRSTIRHHVRSPVFPFIDSCKDLCMIH